MKSLDIAIEVKDLHKSYDGTEVLKGISFNVPKGSILGVLGPNGAGKTTTVRILSTLLKPDSGTAIVNGFDILDEPEKVHGQIGLTGQYAAVDEYLSGRENIELVGRLYRLSVTDCKQRANDLLHLFDLVDSADKPVKNYSGGMKRRIDLAMSLVASPPIIFLDEPTTGLDPRSRMAMWEMVRKLAKLETTVLLTTQYMEEADHLADNIIVIDNGKIIAEGTPDELKSKVGASRLEIIVSNERDLDAAEALLDNKNQVLDRETRTLSIPSSGGTSEFRAILRQLEDKKIETDSIAIQRPSLDDVFMSLTGHSAEEKKTDKESK